MKKIILKKFKSKLKNKHIANIKNTTGKLNKKTNYVKSLVKSANCQIQNIDCFIGLKNIKDNSIDLIVTDPPYFIDGMGDDWNKEKLSKKRYKETTVASLPGGMKFDIEQSKKTYEFSLSIGKEYLRVLKPGGFLISFSQGRLYHSMAMGFDHCGFEIRDMLGWTYEGQAKAFSLDHFIEKQFKNKKISKIERDELIKKCDGRKTPQLKPMIEPMCLAQKPKEGTNLENWLKWGVGLIDVTQVWNDKFPGNIIHCPKPNKEERGENNDHLTVKPVKMIEHIIKIFSQERNIVLDPFLGSGTTAIAALSNNRKIVGFEINSDYYNIIKNRIKLI